MRKSWFVIAMALLLIACSPQVATPSPEDAQAAIAQIIDIDLINFIDSPSDWIVREQISRDVPPAVPRLAKRHVTDAILIPYEEPTSLDSPAGGSALVVVYETEEQAAAVLTAWEDYYNDSDKIDGQDLRWVNNQKIGEVLLRFGDNMLDSEYWPDHRVQDLLGRQCRAIIRYRFVTNVDVLLGFSTTQVEPDLIWELLEQTAEAIEPYVCD